MSSGHLHLWCLSSAAVVTWSLHAVRQHLRRQNGQNFTVYEKWVCLLSREMHVSNYWTQRRIHLENGHQIITNCYSGLVATGHTMPAFWWIRSRISTTGQSGRAQVWPSKGFLSAWGSRLHLIHDSLAPMSPYPKWHLYQFVHSLQSWRARTDRAHYSSSNSLHLILHIAVQPIAAAVNWCQCLSYCHHCKPLWESTCPECRLNIILLPSIRPKTPNLDCDSTCRLLLPSTPCSEKSGTFCFWTLLNSQLQARFSYSFQWLLLSN